mgnify:CR=1 FL=1
MFLPEEENVNVVVEDNTNDYIAQIKNLKESSVSKDDYNKLKADNKRLIEALANGTPMEDAVGSKVNAVDKINECRKKLFGKGNNLTNLEYCDTALQLRDALIETGDKDPFLPFGHNVVITESDNETANRVATVMRECIDYADGDSDVFTNELQRRTVDVVIPKKK